MFLVRGRGGSPRSGEKNLGSSYYPNRKVKKTLILGPAAHGMGAPQASHGNRRGAPHCSHWLSTVDIESPFVKNHAGVSGFSMGRWARTRTGYFLNFLSLIPADAYAILGSETECTSSHQSLKEHPLTYLIYIYLKTGLNLLRSAAHQTKSACGAISWLFSRVFSQI